ncbi:MAG TPA: PEP-CTERM sorting domain-containing protein, partial [Bryobacteraceae bacterium]|nr:PEP-CTERM sorting domain-containing protein [Bryobacteraceae bacterium]
TAQVSNYNLTGQDFIFTLTSVNGALAFGSITSVGFNFVDSGVTDSATLVSSTDSNYSLVDGPIAANATGLAAILDFALLTGPNFNGGGNPNNGITPGHSATFDVRANFGTLTADQIAMSVVARFQNGTPTQSDVATFSGVTSAAPEPGTYVLSALGLIGLGVIGRKRNA